MVEHDYTSSEHGLRVAGLETVGAEIIDLLSVVSVCHEVETSLGLEDVAEHLETHQMVVVHNLVRWVLDV